MPLWEQDSAKEIQSLLKQALVLLQKILDAVSKTK